MLRRTPRRSSLRQLALPFPRGRGGAHKRAGRKRVLPGRPRVPHRTRPRFPARYPLHVTLRLCPGLPRLRGQKVAKVLKRAFAHGCKKDLFRICHFSIQANHLHLVCEARDATALARGVQGFKIRVARAVNTCWKRSGPLFGDRYHAVILKSPSQVKNVLVYVLQNGLRHGEAAYRGVDLFSSAWYFDGWTHEGWRRGLDPPQNPDGLPVAAARGWLLTTGWKLRGKVAPGEIPPAARG